MAVIFWILAQGILGFFVKRVDPLHQYIVYRYSLNRILPSEKHGGRKISTAPYHKAGRLNPIYGVWRRQNCHHQLQDVPSERQRRACLWKACAARGRIGQETAAPDGMVHPVLLLVSPEWAITRWRKSTEDLAVGAISWRQGCPSWGKIWKKLGVKTEKCWQGQTPGLTNRNCTWCNANRMKL